MFLAACIVAVVVGVPLLVCFAGFVFGMFRKAVQEGAAARDQWRARRERVGLHTARAYRLRRSRACR